MTDKITQLKINNIKPNPFKKQINGGKLNEESIKKIQTSINELGLMGSIPVFKKGNTYYAISHHHRLEALKRVYGKDYNVEVVVHNYNDDKALRGMVVENLTQRNDNFNENVENLKAIRDYLKKNVAGRTPTNQNPRKQNQLEVGSTSHIAEWLNLQGEVMPLTSIKEHLSVADNLDATLYGHVKKTHKGNANERTNGTTISKSQAILLATIKDKEEQKALAKNLLSSREDRVRDQSTLLAKYKKLKTDDIEVTKDKSHSDEYIKEGWEIVEEKDDKVKLKRSKTEAEKEMHKKVIEAIQKGERDIADVDVPIVLPKHKKSPTEINVDFRMSLDRINFKEVNDVLKDTSITELEKSYLGIEVVTKKLELLKQNILTENKSREEIKIVYDTEKTK